MNRLMLLLLLLVILTGCTRWQVTDMWFTGCDPDDPAYDVGDCRWFMQAKCGVTYEMHEVTLESYMSCETGMKVREMVKPDDLAAPWTILCEWDE